MKNYHIKKSTFKKITLLIVLIIGIVFFLVSKTENRNSNINIIVVILSIVNIVISSIGIISETKKHAFSFTMMFWMYNFLFMGTAPLIQYLSNWKAWGLTVSDDKYIECQLFVLLWMLCFNVGRRIENKIHIKPFYSSSAELYEVHSIGAMIAQVLIVVYLIATLGKHLFFKGAESDVQISNSTLYLLNHHFFRNMVYYLAILQVINYKIKGKYLFRTIIAIALLFVGCFPLGISRYMIGSFYLGLLIVCLGRSNLKGWFPFIFLFSLMIVFPLSNMFRFSSSLPSLEFIAQNARLMMQGTYNTGNYDAFHMFTAATEYTKKEGYSFGYQMLGALLFFVPRSIWNSKPVGTGGEVIVSLNNAQFSNVSMPLVGEAYINFGIIGICLFGMVVGILCEKYDKKYWSSDTTNSLSVIYPSAIMYFFFLNRGDMLSGGSYMIANIIVGLIAIKLLGKNRKYA